MWIKRYLIIYFLILLTNPCGATVFFSFDGESGYQYMGSGNAHPGGGYFEYMGGNVSKPGAVLPSDCSYDVNNYHYTILSNESVAQGAVTGSTWSLKQPYVAACSQIGGGEAYQRDVTEIILPSGHTELYIRWYQKFTGAGTLGSSQIKLTKFTKTGSTSDSDATGYTTHQGGSAGVLSQDINNIDTQFGNDYWGNPLAVARFFPVLFEYTPCKADDINNQFSNFPTCTGNDYNFPLSLNTWYCFEMHLKLNSNGTTSDAEYHFWIDGHLYMQKTGFKYYNNSHVISDIATFDFRGVMQGTPNVDQPYYMDNIVIADSYIGPFGSPYTESLLSTGVFFYRSPIFISRSKPWPQPASRPHPWPIRSRGRSSITWASA